MRPTKLQRPRDASGRRPRDGRQRRDEDAAIPFISLAGVVDIMDPVEPWVFKTPYTDRMAREKILEDMKAGGTTSIGMISGTDG